MCSTLKSVEDFKRYANFTESELCLLKDLVKLKRGVLECKKSDATTWKEKNSEWEELATEFNTKSGTGVLRSAKNLKNKWENLKKTTRKKFAAEKQDIFKTGGGSKCPVQITTFDTDIKDILGVSCTGLSNEFDSDNIEIIHIESSNEQEPELRKESFENWDSWTPVKLKSSLSTELCTKLPKVSDDAGQSDNNTSKLSSTPNMEHKGIKRKKATELTQNCRAKINLLSEARLQLVKIQKESYLQEMQIRQEQHNMTVELHDLEIEKRKLELSLLQRKLERNDII